MSTFKSFAVNEKEIKLNKFGCADAQTVRNIMRRREGYLHPSPLAANSQKIPEG
jgi:hypothetical protein